MVSSALLVVFAAAQAFAQQSAWGQCEWEIRLYCAVYTDVCRWWHWMVRRNDMRIW